MSGPNNNNNNNQSFFNVSDTSGFFSNNGTLASNTPPDNFDPLTLKQAIISRLRARQRVPILDMWADYSEVVMGWAEAIGAVQNPINSTFSTNDTALFNALGGQGGGSTSVPSLLFDISGPMSVGDFVYQNGSNAAAQADYSSYSLGPVVGVAIELSGTTVKVQNRGSYTFDPSFPPLTPDTVYYAGVAGAITANPSPSLGGYVQEIGYAKTQYELVLNLQEAIIV